MHRARLAAFENEVAGEDVATGAAAGNLTMERWRGETVRMGVLYERAAIEFWTLVADSEDTLGRRS
jgi:hypothetical protein